MLTVPLWARQFVILPLHPLFYITISYIFGIWMYTSGIFLPMLLLYALGAFCVSLNYPAHRMLLMGTVATYALSGFLLDRQQTQQADFSAAIDNKIFNVTGEVVSIAAIEHRQFHYCTTVKTICMKESQSDEQQEIAKIVQLYTHKKPTYVVADIIELHDLPFKKMSKSSFNDYSLKEGISATLFISQTHHTLIERPAYSPMRWLFYRRDQIVAGLRAKMPAHTFNLFTVLFLGKHTAKNNHKEPLKDNFAAWGLTHYLARSGLHMVIFVMIWHALLNILPISHRLKQSAIVVLGLWYYLLSWPSISFNRAFATFLLQKICSFFYVQTNLLHLLTIVCLVTLIANPCQAFFLDFQLSFGLTFALALMSSITIRQRVGTQNIAS